MVGGSAAGVPDVASAEADVVTAAPAEVAPAVEREAAVPVAEVAPPAAAAGPSHRKTQSVRVDNDPAVPNAVVTPPDAPRKLPGEKDEEHDKDDGGGDGV